MRFLCVGCVILLAARLTECQLQAQEAQHDALEIEPSPESSSSSSSVAPPLTPSLLGAGRAASLVYVGAEGGWDAARQRALFETNMEVPAWGRVSIRAGVSNDLSQGRLSPSVGMKLDLLGQERDGVDGAVFGGYRAQGFNLVPAVEVGMAIGRHSDRMALMSSAAYGQGLQQNERYGDVRAAALGRVVRRIDLNAGIAVRAKFDLERGGDEPAGEAGLDGVGGPLVVLGIGKIAISGQAGVGVLSLRAGGPTRVGVVSSLGVGASF